MVVFERILCPIDLSDASMRALTYAAGVARWYGARVTALHVVPTFEPMELRAGALFDPVQFVHPLPRERVLEQVRESITASGIPAEIVDVATEAGDPVAVIVDQAVTMRADLVVMSTHGRSGVDRLLLGSIAEKVLRRAPCPVLTVPPHAPPPTGDIVLRKILCPIDFSPAALQAVGFAIDLARRAAASLVVLQVIEFLAEEDPRESIHFDVPEFRRHLVNDTHSRLEAFMAGQPDTGHGTVTRVATGRAYREILQMADDERSDLIVMGAQGRGGPMLAPLGTTAQQVVRAAPCPVFTVRAPILTE